MVLHENWRLILKRAWSIRMMLLAGLLSGAEVVVPLFADSMPRGLFAVLSFASAAGALVARIVAQPKVNL